MEIEIKEFIKKKIEFYDLMSMIFMSEPDCEFGSILMEILNEEYFPFSDESEIIGTSHMQIKNNFLKNPSMDFVNELRKEWYLLFFNPYGIKASPWQSSYTNNDNLLYQVPNYEVKNFYARYKYKVKNEILPGDHISIELEFLKKLAEKEYALVKASQSEETSIIIKDNILFIDNHLLSWIDAFINKLTENESFFYCNFAIMTKEICCIDRNILTKTIKGEKENEYSRNY